MSNGSAARRSGGQPIYSERKGHPALRARHRRFHITREYVDRWLGYMREALDEVGIPEDPKRRIDAFLTHAGYFMQNVDDHGDRIY